MAQDLGQLVPYRRWLLGAAGVHLPQVPRNLQLPPIVILPCDAGWGKPVDVEGGRRTVFSAHITVDSRTTPVEHLFDRILGVDKLSYPRRRLKKEDQRKPVWDLGPSSSSI